MSREPKYCRVRGHWCTCSPTCEDVGEAPRAHFRPTMTCDHCKTESHLYESHPTCRECCDIVCEACGADFDAETNSITCKRCSDDLLREEIEAKARAQGEEAQREMSRGEA